MNGTTCAFALRAWDTITPWEGVDFNTRLTWEPRYWWTPDSKHTDNHDVADGQNWMMNDVNFDNLNLRIKFKEAPATLTVGRQDIILGEGWLVLDGTPLDAPRPSTWTSPPASPSK